MENPSELWLKRDHKHDLAFRPLETSIEKGVTDAMYTQSGPFQHLQEATGKMKAIEDLYYDFDDNKLLKDLNLYRVTLGFSFTF